MLQAKYFLKQHVGKTTQFSPSWCVTFICVRADAVRTAMKRRKTRPLHVDKCLLSGFVSV